MKTFKDLKKAISEDENLKKQFMSLNSFEQAVALAYDMGYNISLNEIKNDFEINEDVLESVAGGSKNVDVESESVKVADIATGNETEIKNKTVVNEEIDRFQKLEESYRK